MCLLMVSLGQIPNIDHLYNASENNPDGFGFAVNHGDRIVTGRSMKHERLIERFVDEMRKSDNPVGMFHARYTTHGTTTLENNHPFRVDGRHDTVLAHNGMMPITPRAGDDRSDTRIFAEDILGSIGLEQLDDRSGFQTLENLVGASKVAILTNAPELRDSVYILNEDMGDWDGDIWWSNSTYKYSYNWYKPAKHSSGSLWQYSADNVSDIDDVAMCQICVLPLTNSDINKGLCPNCEHCVDCIEYYADCLCYHPTFAAQKQQLDTIDHMAWDY